MKISFMGSRIKHCRKVVNCVDSAQTRWAAPFRSLLAVIVLLFSPQAWALCVNTMDGQTTVLALGDSLTAGYGLAESEGFTSVLEAGLVAAGYDISVTNGGVSGDTSTGGLQRLPWMLTGMDETSIALVIVELGANDALRGIDPSVTRENIDGILATLTEASCRVLLTGMMSPPNLGIEYGAEFSSIYPDMAQKYGVALYPFFLDGVAADRSLNQPDGIHPNVEGVRIMVDRILPYVEDALRPAGAGG